jgi:acetyl-CoA synthetase
VESALASHAAVAESAAVGVPNKLKGEAIWCFVVTRPDAVASDALSKEMRRLVAERLGRSFMPARVLFVPELPRTRSAKIVRRTVRDIALGQDPGDLSSLENPEALEALRLAVSRP